MQHNYLEIYITISFMNCEFIRRIYIIIVIKELIYKHIKGGHNVLLFYAEWLLILSGISCHEKKKYLKVSRT